MSDQCKFCSYRGSLVKCMSATCGHHENWVINELVILIQDLTYRINAEVSDSEHLEEVIKAEIVLEKFKNEK